MKRIICWLKAIPLLITTGIWFPHDFIEDSCFNAIVISNKHGFRISNDYTHREDERVHPNATVIKIKCKCCGKTETGWYVGEVPII